jgi:uncharacterized membrane protein YfcA
VSHAIIEALAIFGAGIAAGTINTVVGSGTLITFPTLLAFGYAPVLANVTNNVGLVPGVASGAYGYRAELTGQRRRVIRLGSASVCGGLVGAILLLVLPAEAFKAIVPALIGVALVLVIVQPRLSTWVAARQQARDSAPGSRVKGRAAVSGPGSEGARYERPGDEGENGGSERPESSEANATGGLAVWVLVFATGIYGGYFGAAQGVLLLGLLGIAFTDGLQRINAVKNVLAGMVNGVAALVFIAFSHVAWGAAGLIAAGSIIGGQIGAQVGRRLPPWALRLAILCVGTAALVKLLA